MDEIACYGYGDYQTGWVGEGIGLPRCDPLAAQHAHNRRGDAAAWTVAVKKRGVEAMGQNVQ